MKIQNKIFKSPGFAYALAAAVLFGASTPASKLLLDRTDPWLLAGLLYFGSGIGLLVLFCLRPLLKGVSASESSLRWKDFPWLSLATLFGGILAPVLLMEGLSRVEATSASLLLNFEGALTTLTAWFVFREHFDRRIVTGMGLILLGGIVLSWPEHPALKNFLGPLLIAGACLSWAIDNNVTREISANDPLQIAMVKSLVAGTTNMVLALSFGGSLPRISVLAIAGMVGFLSYGISLVCFVLALRHIGTSRTGALFSIAPFVGTGLSIVFLNEPLSLRIIMAGALMAVGTWLYLTEQHEHAHWHEAMEHEHLHFHDEHHQHEHGPNDPSGEPHSHWHRHDPLSHSHPHFPDLHHRHRH